MSGGFDIPYTVGSDIRHFKQRAVMHPCFALAHLPAVAGLYTRKYLPRCEALFRSDPHAAGKRRFPGMSAAVGGIPDEDAAAVCSRIPFVEARSWTIKSAPLWSESANEPEDFFAGHRFAWLLTSDPSNPDTAREVRRRLDEWIARHKDKAGLEWESYSACERVCNLASWLSLVPPETRPGIFPVEGAAFLKFSAGLISSHLEYYGPSRTNNHILNNGRALVMLGRVLGYPALHAWGVAIFERMLPVMVGRDGMLRERSSHYQFVVLGWVLDALRYAATPKAEELLAPYTWRMGGAALRLLDERGGLAAEFGDISPDMSPNASIERLDILHPGWRDGVIPAAGPVMDDWYFLSSGTSQVIANYPAGGYPLPYPTHGHCDFTSFIWNFGGERILADAGRYRYTTDAVSERQRSAVGHNLPLVDGFAPLCEPFGVSGWAPAPYAAARLEAECPGSRRLVMRHTGLERVQRGMRHARTIDVYDEGIDVEDAFMGNGEHTVTLLWHFPPAFKSLENSGGVGNGRIEVTVVTVCGVPAAYHWFHGEGAGLQGSSAYGIKESRTTLAVECRGAFPVVIRTMFRVRPCAA